jgi:hypothetical protein
MEMSRAANLRSTIAISATLILVSLGFEIKSRIQTPTRWDGWERSSAWLFAFVFSLFLVTSGTALLWKMAVRLRTVRKFILGRTWIEGTWFIETVEHLGDKREITRVGLAQFSYELPDLVLDCRVSSVMVATGDPIETKVASIVLDDRLNYMHCFTRYVQNVQEGGAAYGTFICDNGKRAERYEGGVVLLNAEGKHNCRQTAVKLSDKEVRALSKQYGSDWQQRVLHNSEWVSGYCKKYSPVSIAERSGDV